MKFRSQNERLDFQWRVVLAAIHGTKDNIPRYRCKNGHLNYTKECETCKARKQT